MKFGFVVFRTEEAQRQCRFCASWILFAAYFPLVLLYCVWLPLTFMGEIQPPAEMPDKDEQEGVVVAEVDKSNSTETDSSIELRTSSP